jgi:hypothetical protein
MKIFGINFKTKEEKENEQKVFIKCSKCGIDDWRWKIGYKGEDLCQKCLEEKHQEEYKLEKEKRESAYCKNGEHDYIGITQYGHSYICSKCGKYLN